MSQLSEAGAAYTDFAALLEHPGWKRFRLLQEAQVRQLDFELRKPLVTLEAAINDQFYKGEVSGMTRLCALAEAMPEILSDEIKRLKEIEDAHGRETPSSTDADRAAQFRASRFD